MIEFTSKWLLEKTMEWIKSLQVLLLGLLGIGAVIVVHEFGHFLLAQLWGVPTPLFSIGFGPALIQIPTRFTVFQLSLIPLGGYVVVDPAFFALQHYLVQMSILIAGVGMNFLVACFILLYLTQNEHGDFTTALINNVHSLIKQRWNKIEYFRTMKKEKPSFLGPIGIIQLMGNSAFAGIGSFLYVIALINIDVGQFNLFIPFPFFDGGKMLFITLQKLGLILSPLTLVIISFLLLIMLSYFFRKRSS